MATVLVLVDDDITTPGGIYGGMVAGEAAM
jgi:hypothetical protein